MSHLKRLIRRVLAAILYYSGLLWLIAEFKLRGRATVLMYHRVLPPGTDTFSHYGIVVSPETFALQMQFLKRHFRPLTPEQFSMELTGPGFGRRSCLVTFDDGWQDNHHHALPILKQHGIPAVIFVATAFVGTNNTFWQERLTRLLFLASRSTTFGAEVLTELDLIECRSMRDDQAARRLRDLVTTLKQCEPTVTEQLIHRLESDAKHAGIAISNFGDDRFLSWNQLQELSESGLVSIGSHAHTHAPLPSLGYAGSRMEFERSLQELQDHGASVVKACAYPHGHLDDSVVDAARIVGFSLGFSTVRRSVRGDDDPLRLPRTNVHEGAASTRPEFLCLILGVL